LAILFAARVPLLSAAGHWLDVGERSRPSDYCLVLSGDVQSRPFVAAALFDKGYVRREVWLTHPESGQPMFGEPSPEAAEVAILKKLGVPASRIAVLDGDCESTYDEAVALAKKLAGDHSSTVTIVTSNFHTRRSRYIFEKTLAANGNSLHFVSVPTDYFTADNWWTTEEGVASYSKEFLKLPFYVVRYGNGWLWIVAIVGLSTAVVVWRRRTSAKARLDGAPGSQHKTPNTQLTTNN
jgi:hypothetical protein